MAESITGGQIRTIWGMREDAGLSEEELYCIIARVSGQDSMRALSKIQANMVIKHLIDLKEKRNPPKSKNQKRTDENGNQRTTYQRGKIYELTGILGWNDNNNRINGFVKRMFKVNRIEWLTPSQCSKLIEILKKMIIDNGLGKKLENSL